LTMTQEELHLTYPSPTVYRGDASLCAKVQRPPLLLELHHLGGVDLFRSTNLCHRGHDEILFATVPSTPTGHLLGLLIRVISSVVVLLGNHEKLIVLNISHFLIPYCCTWGLYW